MIRRPPRSTRMPHSFPTRRSSDLTTGDQLRTVKTEEEYAFFKTTWQITDRDRLTGTFFNDPYTRDGSTGATTLNNRSVARDQGGANYKFKYRHAWDNLTIGSYGFRHDATNRHASGRERVCPSV